MYSTLNYTLQGDGSPIVLIHGLTASLHDWDYLAPELASNGNQAIACDLIGHGDSPWIPGTGPMHIDTVYRVFQDWISDLRLSRPISMIGHSLGSYLAIQYAQDHPEKTQSLVLISPYYSADQLFPVNRWIYEHPLLGETALRLVPQGWLVPLMKFDKASATIPSLAKQQTAADAKRAAPATFRLPMTMKSLEAELPRLDLPVLVLWGEDDLLLRPPMYQKMVSLLPSGEGQSLAGCGHQPHLEKIGLVNKLVLEYLFDGRSKNQTS